jgi:hypothetical protein
MRSLGIVVAALVGIHLTMASSAASEAPSKDVQEAYHQLINSPLFPKDLSPADERALKLVRAKPELVMPAIIATMSKGGDRNHKAAVILDMLPLSSARKLEIARDIARTYDPGEGAPMFAYLVQYGSTEDAERIEAEFIALPKSRTETARFIAASGNQHAIDLLGKLRWKVPGDWQNEPDTKRVLDQLWSGVLCEVVAPAPRIQHGSRIVCILRLTNCTNATYEADLPYEWPANAPGILEIDAGQKAAIDTDRRMNSGKKTVLLPGERVTLCLDITSRCIPAGSTEVPSGDYAVAVASSAAKEYGWTAVNVANFTVTARPRQWQLGTDDWGFCGKALRSPSVDGMTKLRILQTAAKLRPDLQWDLLTKTDDAYAIVSAIESLPAEQHPNPNVLLRLMRHEDIAVRRCSVKAMGGLPKRPDVTPNAAKQLTAFLATQGDHPTLFLGGIALDKLNANGEKGKDNTVKDVPEPKRIEP